MTTCTGPEQEQGNMEQSCNLYGSTIGYSLEVVEPAKFPSSNLNYRRWDVLWINHVNLLYNLIRPKCSKYPVSAGSG